MSISPRLIQAAQSGSAAAINKLLSLLRGPVYRSALRIVGPHDADDCAQETLLILFRRLSKLDPFGSATGYACSTSIREAIRLRASLMRTTSLDALMDDGDCVPRSREDTPLEQLSQTEEEEQREARVRAVLDRIQATLSGVLLRGFVARREGLTDPELAARHGVPEDTARSWKYRCIRGHAA